MIDPSTGWFEVAKIPDYSADAAQCAFDDTWLSRYPRPAYLGYDNGTAFQGVFETMRKNYGMRKKNITTYNPQANGIIERVHLVLADAIQTRKLQNEDLVPHQTFGAILSSAAFAICSTFHTTLQATPAQLVYGRDMLLPIRFKANWNEIRKRRQDEIQRNNISENAKRKEHHYQVGDKILLTNSRKNPNKMDPPRSGPFLVESVYSNGTLRIQRGAISERVNIRRVTPFFESNDSN